MWLRVLIRNKICQTLIEKKYNFLRIIDKLQLAIIGWTGQKLEVGIISRNYVVQSLGKDKKYCAAPNKSPSPTYVSSEAIES